MQLQIKHVSRNQFKVVRVEDGKDTKHVDLTSPETIFVGDNLRNNLLHETKWYLEDYLNLPLGAYQDKAERIFSALKQWGQQSFEALFIGRARDWFQDARRAGLENLRIKISSDAPSILSWPWEALWCDDDEFLAQRCCIERQLTLVGDPLPLWDNLSKDQINMLIVIARPYGDSDVGYHTLARPIVDFVKENNLPVHIDVLRPPTFDNLRDTLKEKRGFYHIVHFDGHGGYGHFDSSNRDNYHTFQGPQGVLVFENKEGQEDLIQAKDLSQLLAEHRIPIMVLNACQSGLIDDSADDCFSSVACSLLKAGIRSVVAMSYSLYVSGAKEFVPEFYRRIFKDGNVADAVRAGRQAMFQHRKRDCSIGQYELQDWLVPVLYQQLPSNETIISAIKEENTTEKRDNIPDEIQRIGDYGFIGRERAIQALERAVQTQPQAGILIHGMAGIGKTTLAKGFLHWLADTNGIENKVFWFSFEEIRSAEYVFNQLTDSLFGTNALASSLEEKISALVKLFRERPFFIVWDNFESVSGIAGTEVTPFLEESDRLLLKDFLGKLRNGKTKILITSRTDESWLKTQECYRLHRLGGLNGEELWAYCNAVVKDLGLTLDRNNKDYVDLIGKLDGNPLAIRSILLCLQDRSAGELIKELDSTFDGAEGDESTKRMQSAFQLLERTFKPEYEQVLQLIGLHERYFESNLLKMMFESISVVISDETLSRCIAAMENAGFCNNLGNDIYQMHPALRSCLIKRHAASDAIKHGFVDIVSSFAEDIVLKGIIKEEYFDNFEANFYRALEVAEEYCEEQLGMALNQSLALHALRTERFSQALALFEKLVMKSQRYNKPIIKAATCHHLGMIAEKLKDFETAREWYMKSFALSKKHGNEHGMSVTFHQLGVVETACRNFQKAKKLYKKSLFISNKLGDKQGVAATCHQLGFIASEQHDFETAEKWHKKALKNEKKTNNYSGMSETYHHLGMIAAEKREFQSAESMFKKSLAIKIKLGNEFGAAQTYHHLGIIASEKREFHSAEKWYKRSVLFLNYSKTNFGNPSLVK